MHLYEIDDAIEAILNRCQVDETTGEMELYDDSGYRMDLDAALDALNYDREKIALHLACAVKGELAEAEAVEGEKKRLARREQIHRNRAERLKRYIAQNINGQKYRDARVQIGWRASVRLLITNPNELPESYVMLVRTPLNDVIKRDLLADRVVPGAQLERRNNLQIR